MLGEAKTTSLCSVMRTKVLGLLLSFPSDACLTTLISSMLFATRLLLVELFQFGSGTLVIAVIQVFK